MMKIIWSMDGTMMIFPIPMIPVRAGSDGPRTRCGEGGTAGQNPGTFSSIRKLDIDVDKCVLRVYEQDGISQIEVNVNDKYGATQCYMDKEKP